MRTPKTPEFFTETNNVHWTKDSRLNRGYLQGQTEEIHVEKLKLESSLSLYTKLN